METEIEVEDFVVAETIAEVVVAEKGVQAKTSVAEKPLVEYQQDIAWPSLVERVKTEIEVEDFVGAETIAEMGVAEKALVEYQQDIAWALVERV